MLTETRPNGTQMSRRYNVAGQLVQQVEKDNRSELINQFDFSYDAAGNLIKEPKLPKPESVSLPTMTMTYSAANRLATYNGQAVQFDADGNLLVGPLAGEMANFSFDSRNRLVSAGETNYRYDAENQRFGVNQTSYVINSQPALSQVLVKEENGVKTFYVYGLGLLGDEKEGEYRAYHFDFRGSTMALTDKTGKVVQRFQYGPYGELVKGEASVTPFLFNGKFGVMTDDNGLYYMRARFYSAQMKRFVNMDVLVGSVEKGQTLNRFAYVTGNPIELTDPWGLLSVIEPEKSQSPRNTIQCDGKGGIVVVAENIWNICGLAECVMKHEENHKEYILSRAPEICKGQKNGAQIVLTLAESFETECSAIAVERKCLDHELASCKGLSGFLCKFIINDRLGQLTFYQTFQETLSKGQCK